MKLCGFDHIQVYRYAYLSGECSAPSLRGCEKTCGRERHRPKSTCNAAVAVV